jgi:hypothetical protein
MYNTQEFIDALYAAKLDETIGVSYRLVKVDIKNNKFTFGLYDNDNFGLVEHSLLLDLITSVLAEYMYNPPEEIHHNIAFDALETVQELREHIVNAINESNSFANKPEVYLHFTRYGINYDVSIHDNRIRFCHGNDIILGVNVTGEPRVIVHNTQKVCEYHLEFFLNAIIGMRQ